MSPGVRTMPAEMELPTATAMPKPTPRICRSLPRSLRMRTDEAGSGVDEVSEVGGNGKSQYPWGTGDIIRLRRQKANWKGSRFGSTRDFEFGLRGGFRFGRFLGLGVEEIAEFETQVAGIGGVGKTSLEINNSGA